LRGKNSKLKCKNIDFFLLTIFIYGSAKKPDEKKIKENEQTLAELSSAHRRSQANCQLVQTRYIKAQFRRRASAVPNSIAIWFGYDTAEKQL